MKWQNDDTKAEPAQIPNAASVAGNLEGMSLADQNDEETRHLGPGGYSQWRGEGGSGTWVRKMGYGERFMTGSTDYGCMSTVYNLWFESKADVPLDTIRRTCSLVAWGVV
jgi:hypothetical protein